LLLSFGSVCGSKMAVDDLHLFLFLRGLLLLCRLHFKLFGAFSEIFG
jgi:hypothetical protein